MEGRAIGSVKLHMFPVKLHAVGKPDTRLAWTGGPYQSRFVYWSLDCGVELEAMSAYGFSPGCRGTKFTPSSFLEKIAEKIWVADKLLLRLSLNLLINVPVAILSIITLNQENNQNM